MLKSVENLKLVCVLKICIIEVEENYGLLFNFTYKYFFYFYFNPRKLDYGYNNYRMIQYRGWLLFIPATSLHCTLN